MIDRGHALPIKCQAEALAISRGSVYYRSCPVSEQDLLLMRKVDELHLDYPFAGSRMLRDLLRHTLEEKSGEADMMRAYIQTSAS